VRGRGNLEQAPRLIDTDVTHDVRGTNACVGVTRGAIAGGAEIGLKVVQRGTTVHGRVIETDSARHAVAELRGVLDVAHAGDGVMAADQIGRGVARETMPRRRMRPTRIFRR